jgi:hypothetical protein
MDCVKTINDLDKENSMSEPCLIGIGAIMVLVGLYLNKETAFARYSGGQLVGVNYEPKVRSKNARTVGIILFILGVIILCVAVRG